jgi:4-hydroxy-tetrahydrodipicolinate reductase
MNIALFGYGKMGKTIEKIALNRGDKIVLTTNSTTDIDSLPISALAIDVAIEFSSPQTAFSNIKFCLENDIPVLSGTTGWLAQLPEIKKITTEKNGTFFYASNFSLGVNLFFKLNKRLARLLANRNYLPAIEEIHHIHKLDAPSGTAITLAEDIIKENKMLSKWVNSSTTRADELPIISVREDEIPGTHIVSYKGQNDEITIKHQANNRQGFALGALTVAAWLKDKKGLLSMDDFLDV